MPDIDLAALSATALEADDQIVVRRGAAEPFSMALVDAADLSAPTGGDEGDVLTRVAGGVAWRAVPGPSSIDGGLDLTLLFNNQLI